jgi:hypothetical protein
MTLTTHAIVGATLATLTPNPVLGFIVGFGSHYLLDAIPHWSYSVSSLEKDKMNSLNTSLIISKDSYVDFIKIGIDGVLGLLLSFILVGTLHPHSFLIILFGAAGGMAPDALQFCYWKWKREPLTTFQRLHNWAHTNIRIDDKPVVGVLSQVLIIFLALIIF